MGNEKLIFQSAEIRNLFKTENLIGKRFNAKKYSEIIKNEDLKKIFCNDSINESVDAFISGGLNLTKASVNSYVHRNTLIYRIGKVKKTIGLDLKNFEDCVLYLNAREIFKLLKACDCQKSTLE
ncbi:MAG: helix-turn-helix domain-containing protein [Firmicutes bacterium]|nr:helix-turn-helix domain-containing protein [Bacillota bacterium]